MGKRTLVWLTAVLDRSLYSLIPCVLVAAPMLTFECGLPTLAFLSQAAGLHRTQAGTWTTYTFENTSHRGDQVTTVTNDAPAGSSSVPVDFASQEDADAALASGYVMFGGRSHHLSL